MALNVTHFGEHSMGCREMLVLFCSCWVASTIDAVNCASSTMPFGCQVSLLVVLSHLSVRVDSCLPVVLHLKYLALYVHWCLLCEMWFTGVVSAYILESLHLLDGFFSI